jgi:tetratricopeptide (TPR) repeat protein
MKNPTVPSLRTIVCCLGRRFLMLVVTVGMTVGMTGILEGLCWGRAAEEASAMAMATAAVELADLQKRCAELVGSRFDLAAARPLVERLVALTKRIRDEEHPDSVVALHYVAFLAQQSGRYAEAEKTWLRSLAIQKKQSRQDPIWFSRTLHMLAGVARDQFDFPRAMEYLHQALEMREKNLGPHHPETAGIVRTLGRLAARLGDFARAEALLLRSLDSFERAGRYYESEVTEVLGALAALYLEVGDVDKAEPLLKRSLALNEKHFGLEQARSINALSGLATVRRHRGDLAGAEALFRRALALREKISGPDDLGLGWPLHQLGEVLSDLGRFEEAENHLQRWRRIVQERLGPAHPNEAPALGALAENCEQRGDYRGARDLYAQALALVERHLGPDDYSTCAYRRDLARCDYFLGQPERALAAAPLIQDAEEKRFAAVLAFTSERQRLIYFTERIAGQSFKLWATIGAAGPLARAVLRTKGVVLDSLIEDRLLLESSSDPAIRSQMEAWSRLKLRVAHLRLNEGRAGEFPEGPSGMARATSAALEQQAEELELALGRQVAGLGGSRRALSVRVEDVSQALPGGSVLIEFIRYRHSYRRERQLRYGALIFRREREPVWERRR